MISTSEARPDVRLSAREIDVIRTTAKRLFGERARVRVFGSRTRLEEKGGDIDLFVETDQRQPNRIASACRLASELQLRLGDQRIDVILVDPATPESPIHWVARQTGVIL